MNRSYGQKRGKKHQGVEQCIQRLTREEDCGLLWKLKENQYDCSERDGKKGRQKERGKRGAQTLKTFQKSWKTCRIRSMFSWKLREKLKGFKQRKDIQSFILFKKVSFFFNTHKYWHTVPQPQTSPNDILILMVKSDTAMV